MNEDSIIQHANRLRRLSKDHQEWRTNTLNLIASENFASPATRNFLSTDLSNRYTARDHFYRGSKFIDEIEALAVDIAKRLFKAKYADVRPISGHICSLILFLSFLKPGDSVVTCPPKYGGYPGSSESGLGRLLRLNSLYFPYDPEIMNIIPDAVLSLLQKEDPQMTVFGSSFIPFPYDIRRSLPSDYTGPTVYDGSHVMGLIAGGEFQQPLEEGCNVLMGSTHKSLFGPQGGLILSNDEAVFSVIDSKIHPGIVDNIHWNRVAALAHSMLELLKFGRKYARQVVSNSRTLAKALHDLGVSVRCSSAGYTNSHQVLLGYGEEESARIANMLEAVDVITDIGIRLGTSEVTRRGMKDPEMEVIASLISDCIEKKASSGNLERRVHRLTSDFQEIEFALK